MNLAVEELKLFYADFEKEFTHFFNELIIYTNKELSKPLIL
jgi:hypothetical protein